MSLVADLLDTAERRADAVAIIGPDGRATTYAELIGASARRAQAYAEAGVGAGDVVLVAESVSARLYAALLALFRLGATAMFPEPGAGREGIRHALEAARPRALIAGARARMVRVVVPELARLPVLHSTPRAAVNGDGRVTDAPPDARALITFTSGSTGRPKGIARSAAFLLLQHQLLESVRRTTPDDVDLISLPIFILSNLAAGATSVIPAGDLRRPGDMDGVRLRRQIAAHKVNRVIAPPAMCARLADGPTSNLDALFTGGGPVFPNLWHDLRAFAPNARLCAVYGSTEAEPIAHVDWEDITAEAWDAMTRGEGLLAGRPIPELELTLEDSEIQVAGPHVNRGYLHPSDDASTKLERDGRLWHRTGDCGRLDDDGRLWLLGRESAVGDGVYPFAIETAALSWPGVRQAALVAGNGRSRLAVAGAGLDLGDLKARARRLGVNDVVALRALPTDRRHNSKIDYERLRARLE